MRGHGKCNRNEPETSRGGWRQPHSGYRPPDNTTVRGNTGISASFQTAAEVYGEANPTFSSTEKNNAHGTNSPPSDRLPNSSVGLRKPRFEAPRRLGDAPGTTSKGGVCHQGSSRGSGGQGEQASRNKVDDEGNNERDKLRAALQGAIVRISVKSSRSTTPSSDSFVLGIMTVAGRLFSFPHAFHVVLLPTSTVPGPFHTTNAEFGLK